ncbi:hypothetical protein H7698_24365 [Pseudomonas sp. p50]|uniref:hypothetical protein n=1 Tax=Pseudomonas sp. p50(2008) TaxID=2816832 RepID=UPI00188CAC25|nr:hypothetical protein [Pseudomonas sp. p50(2008)]MBF4559219.1 hypothetical protein [Pseudomonas sp. p50(2008)]
MDHLFKPKKAVYDVAVSSDGLYIECLYQGHPFYDLSKAICIAMHLIFLKYCPTRSRVSVLVLRRAIGLFFDFAQEYNSYNPSELRISTITDISAEVFKAFENFLREKDERMESSARIKTALRNAASLTDAIPNIMLPYAARDKSQPRMPLTDAANEMLADAFTSCIDELYAKIEFRDLVHQAKAYTYEEIIEKISYSRETIFQWLQYQFDNDKKIDFRSLHKKLADSNDPAFQSFAARPEWRKEFFNEFFNRGNEFIFENPQNPYRSQKILNFEPDLPRVIKTFLDNGYPFGMKLEEIGEKYVANEIFSLHQCKDVIHLLIYRWRSGYTIPGSGASLLWDELLGMYFPTMGDMSCLIQFIMLQTNWNKEAVLAVDPENFEHALTGAMDEDCVMLQTEKNKSQGIDKPYYAPKDILAASSRYDKYSACNLLHLAIDLSSVLKDYEFDYIKHGMSNDDYNPAFLCIRFYADWVKKGGRHTSASNDKAFLQGIKQFLQKYPVFENGEQLMSGQDLTTRLRPTWVKLQKAKKNVSHGLLALMLGHSSPETTDVHYDNSPLAQQERYDRLETEMEAIVALMLSGHFEGMLGTPPQEAVQLPFKVFHIPGQEKPLWACANQRQPTWQGARHRVPEGERCYVISKCMFCRQCTVFEDSLPYLVERRIHVEELIEDQPESSSDYSSSHEIELMKIDSILDNWTDEQSVREAVRYQRRNTPLLPRDLNFLQLILEEEDRK